MSTQTSMVARQVRLQHWTEQIRDCQNRPADMKVEDWCEQHGITKANYYYRLKRVREACLKSCESTTFVEIPSEAIYVPAEAEESEAVVHEVAAILRFTGGVSVEVHNNATAEFLKNLIGAARHAQ